MRGLFFGRPPAPTAEVASTSASERSEKARHEDAARAVLASMTSDPPGGESIRSVPGLESLPERGGNLSAVRGEEAFQRVLWEKRDSLVVVKFGASWCTHCAELLPEFGAASRAYPESHFVLADVDTLPDSARDVRFTPTFTFYRKGKKIDEITKTTPRGLRDHAWMHADDAPDDVARP